MPTYINTKDYEAGMIPGQVWGEFNSTLGADDGHYFTNENIGMIPRERLKDESIGGGAGFFKTVNLGNFDSSTKTITEWFRIDMSELPLAHCLGTDTITTLAGGTPYVHSMLPNETIDGKYLSFAIQKKESAPQVIHSYPSIKVDGVKISGEAGSLLEMESTVIPSHLVNSTAVGANGATGTNFDNLTFKSGAVANRIPFNLGKFWMADYDAATFSDSDVVCPSKFEFNFSRGLEIYSCAQGNTGVSQALIEEPTGGGYSECNVVLEFPRKADDDFVTNHLSGTYKKLKAQWILTQATSGTLNESVTMYWPKLDIENIEQATDGLGKIMEPLQMFAYVSNTASSAMPNVTVPFSVEINDNTATTI